MKDQNKKQTCLITYLLYYFNDRFIDQEWQECQIS